MRKNRNLYQKRNDHQRDWFIKLAAFTLFATLAVMNWPFSGIAANHKNWRNSYSEFSVPRLKVDAVDYAGFIDVADCNVISGWAADRQRLNTSITVAIHDGSTLLTTQLANIQRSDVGTVIGDNGLHGYLFPVPSSLKDGHPHSISVTFESTTTELTNSPRSITCQPPIASPDNTASAEVLNLSFQLNRGISNTTNRTVSLTFTATKQTATSSTDVTRNVTHYRVRESPDTRDSSLSEQPWIPIRAGLTFDLLLRNVAGQRYGERRVMFQVKTSSLTSKVVSDSINLDPELKDYRISATGNEHPLIQYASSQGFTFPLDYYETCDGGCVGNFKADLNVASGHAEIAVQESFGITRTVCFHVIGLTIIVGLCDQPSTVPSGTCRTIANYLLFETRSPNNFWHIKSVAAAGANVVFHGQDRFRIKFQFDNTFGCIGPQEITIGDVVVSGPIEDDFVDPANPWKNAFAHLPPPIQRPPDIFP